MPIQGLDHINIHTSKREETLRFYTEMLDFQEGFQMMSSGQSGKVILDWDSLR